MCCVHKYDYLHAHLFSTGGNKWFLIPIFTLIFTWRYTIAVYLNNLIVCPSYNAVYVWNSIQFRSHLGNLLSIPRGACVYCSIGSLLCTAKRHFVFCWQKYFHAALLADFQPGQIHSTLIVCNFFDYIQWALKCVTICSVFMIWPTWEWISVLKIVCFSYSWFLNWIAKPNRWIEP